MGTKSDMAATVSLPPVLDITAAGPLAAELMGARGKDISVDASKVEKIGAQCIQVLLSAAATWAHDGMEFELSRPTDALVERLGTAGLEPANFAARNA